MVNWKMAIIRYVLCSVLLLLLLFVSNRFLNSILEDLTGCLHYSDNWELMGDGVWADAYDDAKVVADPLTASH
jgi:hypothetical protein